MASKFFDHGRLERNITLLAVIAFVAVTIGGIVEIAPLFWIDFLPPILWALSFMPLQRRRLAGWRLFVVGTLLSLTGSVASLNLISILFGIAIHDEK